MPAIFPALASPWFSGSRTGRLSPSPRLSTCKVISAQVGSHNLPGWTCSPAAPLSPPHPQGLTTPSLGQSEECYGPLHSSTPEHVPYPIQSANSRALGTVALRRIMDTWSGSMMSTSSHTTPRCTRGGRTSHQQLGGGCPSAQGSGTRLHKEGQRRQ